MAEQPIDKEKQFAEASEDSWWYCLSHSCHCAYQKSECERPGSCPYCTSEDYNNQPWDSAMLNNPHFPRFPVSGRAYVQKID